MRITARAIILSANLYADQADYLFLSLLRSLTLLLNVLNIFKILKEPIQKWTAERINSNNRSSICGKRTNFVSTPEWVEFQ